MTGCKFFYGKLDEVFWWVTTRLMIMKLSTQAVARQIKDPRPNSVAIWLSDGSILYNEKLKKKNTFG